MHNTPYSYPPMIAGLLRSDAYPHAVVPVRVRETHISWVLLTGEFAYKIKKPLDLGFADFSTLDRRRDLCHEEVRLNRRFSRDLYLDVVGISCAGGRWHVGSAGTAVEYAVQMRQFDEQCLLSRLLDDGRLSREHIDELATVLARAHEHAARADENALWGSAAQVRQPADENLETLRQLLDDPSRLQQLDRLALWTEHTHHALAPTLAGRLRDGFVRECHGDLHLGNVVLWRGQVTPFDCIEFNPAFRWIDVMSETAFLVMDLDDHARPELASRFLNAYLERTGDYPGLAALPFYLAYRALVRAKVDALRLQQPGVTSEERQLLAAQCHGYLDLAERYTTPRPLRLTITHGLSGSGKTTGTQRDIERHGAIRLRSDVERKRFFGVGHAAGSTGEIDGGIYSPAATEQTYGRLAQLAREVICAGFPLVVDATFLKRSQREVFRQLASELGVPFGISDFTAPESVLRQRIEHRSAAGRDASDATQKVLDRQLLSHEPLSSEELAFVIHRSGSTSPTN